MSWLINPYIYGGWGTVKRVAFPATTYNNVQVRLVLTSSNFDYSKANSDGSDLRFTASIIDSPRTQKLDYWIESWVNNGTSVVWFKVPTAGTTQVFMWWQNASVFNEEAPFTSFMDRGFIWNSFKDMTLTTPTFGGNDTNLNQLSSASIAVAGQTIGSTTVSARWEGWLLPEEVGEYTLGWTDDDGGRAWIDGTQIYNQWADAGMVEYKYATVFSNIKPKSYRYEFYNNAGAGGYQQGVGTRTGRRTNLVINPSFEVDLSGWEVPATNIANGVSAARITTAAAAGTACVAVTKTGVASDSYSFQQTSDSWAPILSGSTYTASMFVKSPDLTITAQVVCRWYDENGTLLTNIASTATALTTAWARYSVSGVAPANARYAMVRLITASTATNGNVHVDGFMLEQINAAGTYFDGTWAGGGWNGTAHSSSSFLDASERINGVFDPRMLGAGTWTTSGTDFSVTYGSTDRYVAECNVAEATRVNTTGAITISMASGQGYLIPASAGEVFSPSVYAKWTAGGAAPTAFCRAQFLDYNLTSIQNTGPTLLLTSSWQRITGTPQTAPAGTCYVRISFGLQSTTVAGTTVRFTAPFLEKSGSNGTYFDGSLPPAFWSGTADLSPSLQHPTDRVNLSTNPSFTVGTNDWEGANIGTAINTLTWFSSGGSDGGGYMRIVQSGPANSAMAKFTNSKLAPCVPGETFYASGYVRSNTTKTANIRLSFYDASYSEISTTLGTSVTLSTSWQRSSVTASAPVGALYVGIRTTSAATFISTEHVEWDQMLLERSTTLNTFFDGSTTGSSWLGSSNSSISRRATGSTTVTYPFPLSWVWGPKFDPAYPGLIADRTAIVGEIPTGLDATLPQDIGLWLDMSDVNVFTKDGSNNVTAVSDKSGLARNFTTGGSGVTYVASARNSKSGCRFGGAGWLQHSSQAAQLGSMSQTVIVAALSSDTVDKDIVWYYKTGSTVQEATTVYDGGGANGTTSAGALEAHLGFDASNNPEIAWGDSGSGVAALIQFAIRSNTTNPKVFGWRIKPGSNPQIILDSASNPTSGTFTTIPSNRAPAPATFVIIGAHGSTNSTTARWLNGDVYEVLVWNRYLSDSEVTAATSYLYSKWAISL